MEKLQPNYKKIYTDIITRKFPEKSEMCDFILEKNVLSALDIIKLNQIIFGYRDKETFRFDQKHRSYSKSVILEILEYQKRNNLNNTQVANQFQLSRNSVAKWKKLFIPDN